MVRKLYEIPDNLEPTGTICVPVFVPNDYDYLSIFHQHIEKLTQDYVYERDDNNSALIVREHFAQMTYHPLIETLIDGTPCGDSGEDNSATCFRMDATSEAFNYYPNDPFQYEYLTDNGADVIAFGMQWHRWGEVDKDAHPAMQILDDMLSGALGYYPNDIMVFPSKILDFALINLAELVSLITFQTFPFPYVRYDFVGSGTADVELLNFPLGCSVLLIPDMELSYSGLLESIINIIDGGGTTPLDWVWTEVNRDTLQIPPETAATQGQEISFDDDGEHNLHVIFIPRINDEIPFFFPFGGIREIQVCGDMKIIGSQTGEQIDKINAGLHSRSDLIMVTKDEICEGMLCAMETVAQRILLASSADNIGGNVGIDKNTGEITIDKVSNLLAPEFDTTFQEQRNGAFYNQANQFANAFIEMNAKITAGWAEATIGKIISFNFAVIELATFGMISYHGDDPQITIDVALLSEAIYCWGDFRQGLFGYAMANHTESEVAYILDLATEIPNSTLSQWYADGKTSPLTLYTGYSCYRLPSQTYHMDSSNYSDSTVNWYTGSLTNRRYRVEIDVIEPFLDANGNGYDGVYWTVNGANPSDFYSMRLEKVGAGTVSMLSTPAWLNGAGKYVLEFNSPSAIEGTTFQGFLPLDVAISGSMDITIYDLGAI